MLRLNVNEMGAKNLAIAVNEQKKGKRKEWAKRGGKCRARGPDPTSASVSLSSSSTHTRNPTPAISFLLHPRVAGEPRKDHGGPCVQPTHRRPPPPPSLHFLPRTELGSHVSGGLKTQPTCQNLAKHPQTNLLDKLGGQSRPKPHAKGIEFKS